jgi:hypothetical protein
MNNPVIQQTLTELQESLSKIDSARSQVDSVAEKSEQVIEAFSKVLISINSIKDGFGLNQGEFKDNLDKSFELFQKRLDENAQGMLKDSQTAIEAVDATKLEFIQKLDDTAIRLKEFKESLGTEIELDKGQFRKNLDQSFESFKKRLDDNSQITVENSKGVIADIESIKLSLIQTVDKTTIRLKEFEETLSEAENRISQIDFHAELARIALSVLELKQGMANDRIETAEKTQAQFDKLESDYKRKSQMYTAIMVAGFLILIVLNLAMKYG